jgi:hypothetical protein
VSTNTSTATPISLTFNDTDPVSLNPGTIHMIDLATAPAVTKNLNFVSGADGVQTVKFTFSDGANAVDGSSGLQLSFGGQPLYLHYGQTNGLIDYTILVATTSSALAPNGVSTTGANVAYWIDINPDPSSGVGGTYTMHSNGVISNGTETTATNLSSVGGGNDSSKVISNIGGTTQDVFLTTKVGLTVNTNANAIGIGAGQSFSGTDGIRFDFTNGNVTGNGGNAVYTADGSHNTTNQFRQELSLTAGSSNADITVKAILAEIVDDGVYYGDPSGETLITITGIHVYSGTLAQVQAGTATEITDGQNVNGIIMNYSFNPDGTVNIVGMQSGWTFEIETTSSFSALQIDSLSTTGNYKLGYFSYGESSAGDPVDLSYSIVGIDGDGDTVNGTLDAYLYPASATKSGIDDSTPNDNLTGTNNIDYLLGNLGDDVLSGLGGDDLLIGGPGNDTLTGGLGKDTFLWQAGDADIAATDTIKDFSKGPDGDVLNLADLLQGENSGNILSGGFLTSANYNGGNTTLVFDTNGAAPGGATQTIVLEGVDLTNGNSYSTSEVLNQFFQDGNLKVDS